MQVKDVPERPVLEFIRSFGGQWCFLFGIDHERSVLRAMPPGTPEKVALAKMRNLIRRGLVSGCPCGCRGDYVLTPKGSESLTHAT